MMLQAQVREHVSMVTEDISTEDFNVSGGAKLVHSDHQVSGASCQTHLGVREQIKSLRILTKK